jgi:hypothetical protein
MNEFEVAGISYRNGKMDLFTQTNVIRRLAPFLGSFKDIAAAAQAAAADDVTSALAPLLNAAAAMKDEDVVFVMSACLNVVQRHDKTLDSWSKVWNAPAKAVMFDDMNDLMVAWSVIGNVLGNNLSSFLSALPSA